MEQNSSFDSFELQLTEQARGFLRETAKWAKFLSILGFIAVAFMVLGALAAFAVGGGGANIGPLAAMGPIFGGILFLLLAAFYFFPVMYLYKFSSNIKNAFNNNNTQELTKGFEYLKSHYKFVGIFTVIIIAFYILAIIIGIIAGVGAASSI